MAIVQNTEWITSTDIIEYLGKEYYVTKVAQVNYQATSLDSGKRFAIRISPIVHRVRRELTESERSLLGLNLLTTVYGHHVGQVESETASFAQFEAGVAVRLKDPKRMPSKWTYPSDQIFIVMKHNYDKVNIVRLGGDGGRYWRMQPQSLVVVPVNEI